MYINMYLLLKPLLEQLVIERSYPLSPCISNEGITINLKLFLSQRQMAKRKLPAAAV